MRLVLADYPLYIELINSEGRNYFYNPLPFYY